MARRAKDDIDRLFDHHVDIPGRTIFISDDIADYSYEPFIKAITLLDRTPGEIEIIMNTPGGDIMAGMAMYDAIKRCDNNVRIVGTGSVMSMGSIILQAADERQMTERAYMLIHYGSGWAHGHMKDVVNQADWYKRLNTEMEDILLEKIREKHPQYDREQFKHRFAYDAFLSASEALEMGLVDTIV